MLSRRFHTRTEPSAAEVARRSSGPGWKAQARTSPPCSRKTCVQYSLRASQTLATLSEPAEARSPPEESQVMARTGAAWALKAPEALAPATS